MEKSLPKKELMRIIKRFLADHKRGISVNLFAELCGVHPDSIKKTFIDEEYPLTEYMQVRVSKGYTAWRKGQVAIMQNRDTSKFVEYRKEDKPRLTRGYGIQFVDGQVKLNIGLKNRNDYSGIDIDEQLRG